MNTTITRTAPALPAEAVRMTGLVSVPRTMPAPGGKAGASRAAAKYFDFGPISRAEMRKIVLEMIG